MPCRYWRLIGALVVGTGWLVFVTSFFLPATNVVERGGTPPGTPLVAWDAAISSVTLLAAQPLVLVAEPKAFLFLLFPLLNLSVLLSPAIALQAPDKAAWMATVLVLAAMVPMTLPKSLIGDVFVGFYAWLGSFIIMAIGHILVSLASSSSLSKPGVA
jgi:hypothetical protein